MGTVDRTSDTPTTLKTAPQNITLDFAEVGRGTLPFVGTTEPSESSQIQTLLFTDIVGSTALWEADATGMSSSLKVHDDVMRSSIEAAGGIVFGNPGDAFCAAFDSDAGAITAARRIQSALAQADWLGGPQISVRIGLHRGAVEQRGDNVFGPAVNLCARVCDAGHGGQILFTEEVSTPASDVVSCGMHRLKGVSSIVKLFQYGAGRYPPLRTLESATGNVPVQVNDLIGRASELDEIASLIARARLVTMVGMGGVGKTRLSIAVGEHHETHFPDGVWFVELAATRDMTMVLSAVADALRLPTSASPAALADQIRGHHLLLVLDNCEHIVELAAELAEVLLSRTKHLRILATSREALGVPGEFQARIGPLDAADDARALFEQRAMQVGVVVPRGQSQIVDRICKQLDSIPLAIELAAAATRTMGLSELLSNLDHRLDVLTAPGRSRKPDRHHSLRATIDWSYESLSPIEQTFFRRVGVFQDGFPNSGAAAMAAGLDQLHNRLLEALVDRSLLSVQSRAGHSRFVLLESIRQYAYEQLELHHELDAAQSAHTAWCFQIAEDLSERAVGPAEAGCIAQLIEENGNFRQAITTLLSEGEFERAGDLVLHFEDFSYVASILAELVLPLMEADAVVRHPQRRRLLAIELVRRSTSDGTEGRAELAAELAADLQLDDPGSMQIVVLLIANALARGRFGEYMGQLSARADTVQDPAERARLKTAALLGYSYIGGHEEADRLVDTVLATVTKAGLTRLLIPAGSMISLGSLGTDNTERAVRTTKPILKHLGTLPMLSIMSSGLVSMYSEAAVQAGLPIADRLAAIQYLDPVLQGDFNRIGLVLARLVQCEGNHPLAVRAVGACVAASRSGFSRDQRAVILDQASKHLTEDGIAHLLADGATSERSALYREMWAVLSPLLPREQPGKQLTGGYG